MKSIYPAALFLLFGVSALPALTPPATAAEKPNIIVILADDLGIGDLGCYNAQSKIPTPHMDRLAGEGIRFTDAHTPSSVCTPTRYGLLTGRYCWRTWLKEGVLDGFDPPLIKPGQATLASLLKEAGYATDCVGKWHLGMTWTVKGGGTMPWRNADNAKSGFRAGSEVDFHLPINGGPLDCGFDSFFGISASLDMSPYCFIEGRQTVGVPDIATAEDRVSLFMNQVAGMKTKDFTLEGVLPRLTRRAVELIGQHAQEKRPFFLYLPLNSPHLPVVPNPEFTGKSGAGAYGDFVVETDATVGAVMQALEVGGIADNTLVLVTSDNGGLWHEWRAQEPDDVKAYQPTARAKFTAEFGHHSNGELRGTKADIWEGGHRVPFLARWPARVKPGQVSDTLVCLTDVMATCAEAAGMPLPAGAAEDSVSFLPVLNGGVGNRTSVVHHSLDGSFSYREGPWKLCEKRGSGGFSTPKTLKGTVGSPEGQLYQMQEDPAETRNVWNENPEVVAGLKAALEAVKGK